MVARAILHYFSQQVQRQLLSHLRGEQRDSELFVHHSTCFQDAKDAECLSLLYERMGTQKWHDTLA